MRNDETDYPVIAGLKDAIAVAGASPEFEARCRQAAVRGHRTRSLRAERERTGFLRMSFVDYLTTLARRLGIEAGDMLRGFGIGDLATVEEARLAGRLAKKIGAPKPEFLEQVGIGLAALFGEPTAVLGREINGAGPAAAVGSCEAALARLSKDPEAAAVIRSVMAASEDAYDRE